MWFVRRRVFEELLRDYREMQNNYWQVTSEVVDLTADNANLKREVERLRQRITDMAEGKGGRVR